MCVCGGGGHWGTKIFQGHWGASKQSFFWGGEGGYEEESWGKHFPELKSFVFQGAKPSPVNLH